MAIDIVFGLRTHTFYKFNPMKRIILTLLLVLNCVLSLSAQEKARLGFLSYDSLLHAMPEYAQVQQQMQQLRQKYEAEAAYNESNFKRQFAEFLQGQKDFPQNILLKRQRDLQEAMEKGLAFRNQADSLLTQAEADMLKPLYRRLDAAIQSVGMERGYEYVLNTDRRAYPFMNQAVAEDATPYVAAKLGLSR